MYAVTPIPRVDVPTEWRGGPCREHSHVLLQRLPLPEAQLVTCLHQLLLLYDTHMYILYILRMLFINIVCASLGREGGREKGGGGGRERD